MTSTAHSTSAYIKVFYVLLVLTIVEVAIVYLGLPRMLLVALLVIFAVWKASLVAMHFMHLKFEKRTLAVVALTPFVLCVFLILMLMPDIFPH
ncbi:MAG TPA: cytochrome C oxidase subunit IV family protein [Candidatus Eisenbacteria bacterium]|jgi:caa(3)-type oxidase subunit IV|nr:cytochrome C oxidase subunit IV family protein [Candidatus Eisenbacteria bacterium]